MCQPKDSRRGAGEPTVDWGNGKLRAVTASSGEVGVVRPAAGEVSKSQDPELSWWGIDTEEEILKCVLKIHSDRRWWLRSDKPTFPEHFLCALCLVLCEQK